MTAVLVLGSGYQRFREYLLAGVAAAADVVLLDAAPVTWQCGYLRASAQVNTADEGETLAAAARLCARHPVDGVLTWDERMVVPAARLAASLGVASMPVAAARTCRDKARQRETFEREGVPSARYRVVSTAAQARDAAAELGYPVVVKPRSRAASVGVRVAASEADLAGAVEAALAIDGDRRSGYGGFGTALVEECLRGREISVDAWVLDGEVRPFVTAVKRVGFAPYFVETGHVVGAVLSAGLAEAAYAAAAAANRGIGADRCVTHTEVMLTAEGPKVVEVNGRLGGDLIPYLGQIVTQGLSAGAIAASVAVGARPTALPPPGGFAGVHFVYPAHDMTYQRLDVRAGLTAEPWVHEIRELGTPGQQMLVPPGAFLDRAAYCVVTGTDAATVAGRLDRVAEQVAAVGAPL